MGVFSAGTKKPAQGGLQFNVVHCCYQIRYPLSRNSISASVVLIGARLHFANASRGTRGHVTNHCKDPTP